METKDALTDQNGQTVVLACSGASNLGELTDKLARKLKTDGNFSMKCLAMVASDNKQFIEDIQKSKTLVIDGCEVDCGKKIMEEAWLSNYHYIRLTDLGYIKDETPVTDDTVNEIYQKIKAIENNGKVVHERPVSIECTEDNCDMFDFMSDHVGLKVLHPGGVKSTKKLVEHLHPMAGMKVLDIACGKGRTSVYMAKKYGCKVVGVDILESSVKEATEYAKKHKVDHLVSFKVGDAHQLPFEDNEFDLSVAQAMLILVEDSVKVVKEVHRVVKPGGNSAWLELSWKKRPTPEFIETANKEICAACIANVVTFDDWEKVFEKGGSKGTEVMKHTMSYRGMSGMLSDEGLSNGLKVMYRFMTNKSIRNRMIKLDHFFKNYPEYIGYGMYFTSK